MITIPRALARDLRSVFRRLHPRRSGPKPAVELIAGRGGLVARAASGDACAEYRGPGALPEARLLVPLDALADCAGGVGEAIFTAGRQGRVEATWDKGGARQSRSYDPPAGPPPFPEPPRTFEAGPAGLAAALAQACETAAGEGTRYALDRLQLRGDAGEVAATDGRQLFVQGGFSFPWPGDLLVPRCGVFAAPELSAGPDAGVGRSGEHVWFRFGPWSVALPVDRGGRFPDARAVAGGAKDAPTVLRLGPKDAAALPSLLQKLPGGGEANAPVTADLAGRVALRARAGTGEATEVVLAGSYSEGPHRRFATDRRLLARAADLGFREVRVAGNGTLVCCDGNRTYLWMPLGPESVLPGGGSPRPESPAVPPAPPLKRERPPAKAGKMPAAKPAGGVLHEALAVQAALRELLARVRCLTAKAREERRARKAVSATLASLRQLEDAAR